MRFYTASKLGSKRASTPEGFLVCLDVPIARTGELLYAPHELPGLKPGRDGLIRVLRDPEDVFKPESLASFVGKPTTNDHPPEMVEPRNFRRFVSGSALNVRQGKGDQADLVIADLIFCEPDTIKAIEAGKDEISNGYDAGYEEVEPGVYRQVDIIGNHVALVAEGRCGARCSIGDSAAPLQATLAAEAVLNPAPPCGCGGHTHLDAKPARPRKRKTRDMAKLKKSLLNGTTLDRIRRAFAAKDEAGFEEAMNSVEEAAAQSEEEQFAQMISEAVSAAIAPVVARLGVVEADVNDRKMRDSEAAAAEEAKKKEELEANDRRARDEKSDEEKASEEKAAQAATKDSPDLAAFLEAKGLSAGDVAAALAMIKKDDAPVSTDVSTGDESLSEEEKDKAEAGKKNATTDSTSLLAEFRDTVAKAEILFPGIKLPSYDAKSAHKTTFDAMCELRRKAVKSAFDSAERKAHVLPFLDSIAPDFSQMTCDAIKLVFSGSAELAKRANVPAVQLSTDTNGNQNASARGTIVGMNAAAKELWKNAR